jgi:hypothetical protein
MNHVKKLYIQIIKGLLLLIGMTSTVNGSGQNLGVESMALSNQEKVIRDYDLLFLGNSHTRNHSVPEMIKKMINTALPNANVDYSIAPGIKFLDERLHDSRTRKLFDKKEFSHVILQAQKYSQSRRKLYSTKEAEKWVMMTHKKSAIAILFPEWGQRGRQWEGEYVHNIYAGIAKKTSACIAPVGLVWNNVLTKKRLVMHASDGNHSNRTGAFLSALVLFETITGVSADKLPYMKTFDINEDIQLFLRDVVTQTLQLTEKCVYTNHIN